MIKKTKVIIIAVLLVLVAVLVIPTGLGDEIETPFGSWRFEIITTDSNGNDHPMSVVRSIGGQMLQWTHGGEDVSTVTFRLYASAIGSGYDYCDINCGYNSEFYILPALLGVSLCSRDLTRPTEDTIRLTVNGPEVLIIEAVTPMSDFETCSWVPPSNTQELMLVWYFSAEPLRYRGVVGETPDSWQEESIFEIIQSDIEVTWVEGATEPCGDGSCNFGPWPEENCASCPTDCGVCDAEMMEIHTSVGYGLTEDSEGMGFHHGKDDYSWTDWIFPSAPYSIEVFKNADAWNLWVKTGSGTSGKTIKASCEIVSYSVTYHPLVTAWSDSGDTVESDTWYELGFWTEWEENHILISNNQNYKIYFNIWLEGSADSHTLTVNANNYNDETVVTNMVTGASDSSSPYQFELDFGEYYIIETDWYGNNEVKTATSGDNMPDNDKTITMNHPNSWLIGVMHVGSNPPYSTKVGAETQYGVGAVFYRQNGVYTVYGYDGSGTEKTHTATLDDNDFSFVFNWFSKAQMYTGSTFSIVDTDRSAYKSYSYDGNYLGVI